MLIILLSDGSKMLHLPLKMIEESFADKIRRLKPSLHPKTFQDFPGGTA
jgi:hypothetical protein